MADEKDGNTMVCTNRHRWIAAPDDEKKWTVVFRKSYRIRTDGTVEVPKERAGRVSISMYPSVKKQAQRGADQAGLTVSGFIAMLVREHSKKG